MCKWLGGVNGYLTLNFKNSAENYLYENGENKEHKEATRTHESYPGSPQLMATSSPRKTLPRFPLL